MTTAKVTWYNKEFGYGVAEITNDGRKVFLHNSCMRFPQATPLYPGEEITFDLYELVDNNGYVQYRGVNICRLVDLEY